MILILKKYLMLIVGSVLLLLLLFMAFFGQYLPFVDTELKEIKFLWNDEHIPIPPPFAPSEEFPLGTDRLGRDMLSMIISGTKETLFLVIMITIIRYVLAIPLAYFAHKKSFGSQNLVSWLNGTLSYIPTIIIIVLLATLPPILTIEARPLIMMVVIATVELGRVANIIKLEFEDISSKEFILGGVSVGVPSYRLLNKYYLPFIYEKLLISMVADLGKVMFLLGQLGFISIFLSQELLQVNIAEFVLIDDSLTWPTFFMDSFRDIRGPIWIPFYPALAITYSIFTFNVLAQGLQKVFQKDVGYFKG